jgi:hypothetical protein
MIRNLMICLVKEWSVEYSANCTKISMECTVNIDLKEDFMVGHDGSVETPLISGRCLYVLWLI